MYLRKTKQSQSTYLTNGKNKHIYIHRLALEPSSSNLFKMAKSMAKISQSMAKIAKNQKQPKSPSTGEWINKLWYGTPWNVSEQSKGMSY